MWIDTAPSHLKPCHVYIHMYVCTLNTYSKHSTQKFCVGVSESSQTKSTNFQSAPLPGYTWRSILEEGGR